MPRVPLKLALPAAAASLAYLNAKYHLATDSWGIFNAIKFGRLLTSLENEDRVNLFYRFEALARDAKTGGNTFLVVPEDEQRPGARTEWTYAEAYEIILKHAAWLKEVHNVQKDEIIAIVFKNRPEFIWTWWALWSIGALPAFINHNLRDNAFVHCVKIATSRLLLVSEEASEALSEDVLAKFKADSKGRAVQSVIVDNAVQAQIQTFAPYRAPNADRSGAKQATPALLIYTSGTTGLPKAAKVNWAKPLSGANFFPKLNELTPQDRFYTAMPLYHSSAAVLGCCQCVGVGAALIISPKFSPRTSMKEITQTKATVMQYIGEMCRYLVNSPPTPYDKAHNLRLAFGNGMRPDVWQKFKDRFNVPTICEFYAATESPGASYVYSSNSFYRGAIGRSGILARVLFGGASALVKHDHAAEEPWRDPKTGFCERVKADENGELLYPLDPENIQEKFQGYFGNDKATSSKIIRDVFVKGDAWFRTGDLQRRDSDGRWWFVDRIGDTFRWKGENVSTAEVSEVLGLHPLLHEANVYGISLPNHDGRAGCAAIGLREGGQFDDKAAVELAAMARKGLPRYAVPLFLRLSKNMEVTGTVKHQKVALREQGVDPSKTDGDEIWWLAPGSDRYEKFGKLDWERIVGGSAKL